MKSFAPHNLDNRMMHHLTLALRTSLAVAAMLVPVAVAAAAEPAQPAAASPDEAAIRQVNAAYRQAVEKGDFDAAAKCWTPGADYVDHLGHAFKIHAALTAASNLAREEGRIAGPSLKTETLAIRFITPEVAVEDGVVERAATSGDQPPRGRYCALWVKRDGQWLIDGVRESPYHPGASANHFQDLEWIVGEWTAEGPHATAEVSCTWGPNRAYILRHLKVIPQGEEPITVTQWIGWDPLRERIRSFVFDSRGGYGEGVWSKDGDSWSVASTGVRPDGKRTMATNFYSRVDDNTAIWESVDEEIDGQPGLDIRMRATRKGLKDERP